MKPGAGYFRYWGKARPGPDSEAVLHPLAYHCLDVAAVGNRLLRGDPEQLDRLSAVCGCSSRAMLDWMTFLLALHDVGKFADSFQNLRPDLASRLQGRTLNAPYLERHDTLGYRFCEDSLLEVLWPNPEALQRSHYGTAPLVRYWVEAVTGHHGRPPLAASHPPPLVRLFPGAVRDDARQFIRDILALLAPKGVPFNPADERYFNTFPHISWQVAGLAVVADWIGSNTRWFPYAEQTHPLNKYWDEVALPCAKRAVAASGMAPVDAAPFSGIRNLFSEKGFQSLTPLQEKVESIPLANAPQLFIIEEVTGGGKTEAALALTHRLMAAGRADGTFVALPTMATANAMHQRIRPIFGRLFSQESHPSLVLAHSHAQMVLNLERQTLANDSYLRDEASATQDCTAWLSDSRKKALLAHVGVGTIDQALLAILASRYQSLRLFGLSRKVLLVDEVHACDPYVLRLLCTLLTFHAARGGSAILLSATLPRAMRAQLLNAYADGRGTHRPTLQKDRYPLLTRFDGKRLDETPVEAREEVSRRVSIQPLHTAEAVENALTTTLDAGGCACWIRNTVQDALEAYRRWSALLGPERVTLFHARFALGDRLDIEQEVLARFGPTGTGENRRGRLLIATQVVEQSWDLDFDFMVTDLAPIDRIIQRAGRLQRHTRTGRSSAPRLGVLMPEMAEAPRHDWLTTLFPGGGAVYPHHGQLWLTARWLVAHRAFAMPEDARDMIESIYGEASQDEIPQGLDRREQRACGDDYAHASQGRMNALNLDEGYQATASAWADDMNAPTRLGEPTVTVRLAKRQGTKWAPWIELDGNDLNSHRWQLSQLSVLRKWVAEESKQTCGPALDAARKTMPDMGKYCVTVPLADVNGEWQGSAVGPDGGAVTLTYHPHTGLQIEQGEAP